MLNSIKLKLRAFDHKLLDKSVSEIVSAVCRAGVGVSGPIPMPSKIERFTVNRSTNIDKTSREHFKRVSHIRLVIIESSPKSVEVLRRINIASGVDIKVEMIGNYEASS